MRLMGFLGKSKANWLVEGSYWAQSNLGFCSVPLTAIFLIFGSVTLRSFGIYPWIFLFAGLIFFVFLIFAMLVFLRVASHSYLRLKLMEKIPRFKAEWILRERNAEIRKLIIEKIGWTKILADLNAILLDQLGSYQLYKIQPKDRLIREHFYLLKMICPSANSDYVLCVPPTISTAKEAITWINRGIAPTEFIQQT